MCVIAIAWQAHPRWRLVAAANRDEFHDRSAERLHRWSDADLIAGRDISGGGTWLAVSEHARFAALANLRGFGPRGTARASRGRLVTDLALGREDHGGGKLARLDDFGPFQAVSIAGAEATLLSNRPEPVARVLPPGLHVISNGPFDRPWRKSVRLVSAVEQWLNGGTLDTSHLFAALRDPGSPADDVEDPGAIFVDDPVYGTRCSTVVTVDAAGAGSIAEVRYDRAGHVSGADTIAFRWP